MQHPEHRLQVGCVSWFSYAYPRHAPLLFAIPNGGARSAVTGAQLKAEGVRAGVADLCLLAPGGAVFIELKTPKGRQSEAQRSWANAVKSAGYRYEVVRSLEEFIKVCESCLKSK